MEQLRWVEGRKLGQLRVEPGQPIVAEGLQDDRLYTVLEGWAIRSKSLPDGRRQILNVLLPGDLLGLQGELMGAAQHGVEAVTRVNLCAFRRDTFLALAQADPSLGLDIAWLSALSERFSDDILLSVGRRTAMERVAMLLVHLHRRAASAGLAENGTIAFPLTQPHIADALGLSTVHINRVLQALRRQGLIRLAEGRLAIGDLRALRRVAAYWEQPAPQRPLL
ncbi:Crp/Fnr family transcriptional regulator [Roseococcus sp. SYP-B2431]|uniref:Crp/Fnr family transcriptional regulator n=1 Tax=Roseococcus sp. SYP-B2431 TaxID=2496640 RepID=UPI00197EA0FA|nr:Crp/Fnr family transcriptional regulator [Roseococcus sp. SYP-B2431]